MGLAGAASVREKAAVAARTPTSPLSSYSYSSTSDEHAIDSEVETEELGGPEERAQQTSRLNLMRTHVSEVLIAQPVAAPAPAPPPWR